MRRRGCKVILFEKKKYPFHRVCGEYISLESWNYIKGLGLELKFLSLPVIDQVEISAPNGRVLQRPLKLGGFGISRYLLDYLLFKQAAAIGVKVVQECNVLTFTEASNVWHVHSNKGAFKVNVLIGAFGKRSNLGHPTQSIIFTKD